MNTTNYFYAAYFIFWLIPIIYLFLLVKKTNALDDKLNHAIKKFVKEGDV